MKPTKLKDKVTDQLSGDQAENRNATGHLASRNKPIGARSSRVTGYSLVIITTSSVIGSAEARDKREGSTTKDQAGLHQR